MRKTGSSKIWLLVIKRSVLPVFFFLLISSAFFFYQHKLRLLISEAWQKHVSDIFFMLFLFVISFLAHKISGAVFKRYQIEIAAKTKTTLDDKFIPLFRRIIFLAIWVIALIIFLSRLGVNINALIAALGVGSLAIALAAQDTIANIIAGFLIMIDQPFRVGDEIKLPTGEKAKVLEIGIRRSKFYSLEVEAVIIVPNLDLSKSRIINYTYAANGKFI
ncbi:MAG: mechanosensitive ion channel domain-containing protein [Candidatus Omnitrophota bacterium]